MDHAQKQPVFILTCSSTVGVGKDGVLKNKGVMDIAHMIGNMQGNNIVLVGKTH